MRAGLAVKTPHLILGGAKSGKSAFAESLVSFFPPPYTYIATAEVLDGEMRERVLLHRQRRDRLWETVESPLGLPGVLAGLQGKNRPVLVDCITLWLSNLICSGGAEPEKAVDELCGCIAQADYPLFLVSNETGWGIVPENPLARRFRDLAGAANQKIARACSGVTLVAAGLPLVLK
jgi:adenosylcobinamide kinase / adenosylcobinamide-phosphate guanylyltransferase